ncbi:DUF3783 domain-containing protein [Defluviitalea saccharophila]|uniref:DUF3783 domain-containing protein n=1 Tax=Defluviitalea saccharophila TaxID=879970 RepID=A0ABZ2Y7E1_9FIRM|nr:DUF3783 domain-containing protein [Candidatus Epulonipiscium sp.]
MSFQKIDLEDKTRSADRISVMVYGYDENEIKILKAYCDEHLIEHFIPVNDAMIDMSLEGILKLDQTEASPAQSLPAKAVIMNGFSGSDLQAFLRGFKNTGLERPIFATVTPVSKVWPFKLLINELIKEHEMMKNRTK